MDKEMKARTNFMLRIPHDLAGDIRTLAWERGLSSNAMATALLRYAVRASADQVTLKDRLSMMGVK